MKRIILFLDRFHWLWLILAAPLLFLPTPKRSLALLVIPFIWILNVWQNRIEIRRRKIEDSTKDSESFLIGSAFPITPLNLSLLLLTIMLLISLWATYSIEQSLEKISGLVLGLGAFFAVTRVSRKSSGWWWSQAFFLGGGFGWSLLGFLGMDYQVRFSFLAPVISRIPVINMSLPGLNNGLQHNAVGGTLVWILPLLLCLTWYIGVSKHTKSESRLKVWLTRIALWVVTLSVTLVLLLTQSRGSYLAMFLTAICILFVILSKRWRWVLFVLVCITAIALGLYISNSGGWDEVIASLGFADESGLSINTLSARIEIWSRAIYGIKDFPITGMGMNTFREAIHVLYPLFTISPDLDIAHAHNEFMQAALDLGIPGLIAFMSVYIIAFWMLVKIWKSSFISEGAEGDLLKFQDPILNKVLILGLGGGLLGHIFFGMTDAITLGAKPGIFYWLLLGLITGMYKLTYEKNWVED